MEVEQAGSLPRAVAHGSFRQMIRNVVVLGGGSAGLLGALAIKTHFPSLSVRVIHSREIGIIGVGEGSLPDLPKHLHGFLGIDPGEFHRRTRPTYKMGLKFIWGQRPEFFYAFGKGVGEAVPGLRRPAGHYAWDDFMVLDKTTGLLAAGNAFAKQANGAPELLHTAAYHIENADFVAALEQVARSRGVEFTEANVVGVEPGAAGVFALALDTGERVAGDLFVDCSGFRSELLGRALDEPFIPYTDALFCDRAVAGGWERSDEPVLPYTTCETMPAGWCWQIEHERRINRGYVYASGFISDEEAERDFRARNPRVTQTRVVKFNSGRRSRSWVGNVIALGNSSGFVEPLEATAIFVICNASRLLVAALKDTALEPTPTAMSAFNNLHARMWDEIRDFLAIHYRFNAMLDTPFWRHCREHTALHGAEPIVQSYRENGPTLAYELALLPSASSVFLLDGFHTLLLGQKVPHARVNRVTDLEQAVWQSHRASCEAAGRAGLGVMESLETMRDPRWQWTKGFYPVHF